MMMLCMILDIEYMSFIELHSDIAPNGSLRMGRSELRTGRSEWVAQEVRSTNLSLRMGRSEWVASNGSLRMSRSEWVAPNGSLRTTNWSL